MSCMISTIAVCSDCPCCNEIQKNLVSSILTLLFPKFSLTYQSSNTPTNLSEAQPDYYKKYYKATEPLEMIIPVCRSCLEYCMHG